LFTANTYLQQQSLERVPSEGLDLDPNKKEDPKEFGSGSATWLPREKIITLIFYHAGPTE
jgi:hypothetical protein